MISDLAEWLQGFATPVGASRFFAGFFTAYFFYWVWCMYRKRKPRINWRYTGIAVGISAILFSTIQTQAAYTLAGETAREVQECQREFNQTLRDRAKISEDNDHWSQVQRKAIGDWLYQILVPPPEIAELRANDPNFSSNPVYMKWGLDVTTKYSNIMQQAQEEQDANMEERRRHPLPEPTCGK